MRRWVGERGDGGEWTALLLLEGVEWVVEGASKRIKQIGLLARCDYCGR